MNRREALELLASLPAVGSIKRVDVNSQSVVVVECPGELTQAMVARIRDELQGIFPAPIKTVVLCGGMTLRVLDSTDAKVKP